jgi:hypothetical protein
LKKQRAALEMELDQQEYELKNAEGNLLSLMNKAIPEDEEQRQQHMAALNRLRDEDEELVQRMLRLQQKRSKE